MPAGRSYPYIGGHGFGTGAGKPRRDASRIDQQVETWIEQMQDQSPGRLQMAVTGLQRLSLQIDGQEVPEGSGPARRQSQNAGPRSG
jgi:hypothetical protein